ncbi:MAG: ATP-binding cassette domain-containing protein [Myxococcaceae bacterium]
MPEPLPEPVIDARAVHKRYGDRDALSSVDLQVARGELVALVGPSGSGKSTLLRSLLGLVRIDGGEIHVLGQRVDDANVRQIRRSVGYVVQGGGLFPHLSARQNVTLVARQLGVNVSSRVEELRALVQLPAGLLERFPRELSGGQAQRVSLMRALVLDPQLLLLDEPLGALDPITRHDLQDELREIFQRLNKTVVMVTHDLAEAAFFGGRVVLLRDGKIIQQGAMQELVSHPADPFVTRFIDAYRSVPR